MRILLSLLLLLFTLQLSAQRHIVRNYSVKDGLQQSEVSGIVQDDLGNLWLATLGGGLCKFDGLKFDCLTESEGLLNNAITHIIKDHNSTIWLGSADGLSRFDGQSIQNFPFDGDLKNLRLQCIKELSSGAIIVGTDKGLLQISEQEFEPLDIKLNGISVLCIEQDRDAVLWLGSREGLIRYESGNVEKIAGTEQGKFGSVMDIKQVSSGELWLGTITGIYQQQGRDFVQQSVRHRPLGNRSIAEMQDITILSVFEDNQQNLWFGTSGLGTIRRDADSGEFEVLSRQEGLSNNYIFRVFQDQEEQIWFCTSGSGIDKLLPSFKSLSTPDQLISKLVYALETDSVGNVLIGTIQGGFSVFTGENLINYEVSDGLLHRTVRCIFRDSKNQIWIGTEVGICQFSDQGFVNLSKELEVSGNAVYSISEDREGNIWATVRGEKFLEGVSGGVRKWDGKEVLSLNSQDGLINDYVYTSLVDSKGKLWFGTEGGLSLLSEGNFTNYDKSHGLCNAHVFALCEDDHGGIWIGTQSGLSLLKDGEISCLNTEAFSRSSPVYLIEKMDGYMFFGTANGLIKLHLGDFYKGKHSFRSYRTAEGFKGMECNQNAVTKDGHGRLWLGTIDGAFAFDPANENHHPALPKVSIRAVKLFDEGIDWQSRQGDEQSEFRFDYDESNLSFEYKGISMINPEAISYKTMLKNFDSEWSKPSKRTNARYTNLDPGHYEFQVLACNKYGECSPEPASFAFDIEKPITGTWWFRILATAIGFLLATLLYRMRIQRLLKKQQEQARIEKKISQLRLEALRAQMNPHFIFNSLNSIQRYVLANDTDMAARYLGLFSKLIRSILDSSFSTVVSLHQEVETMEIYLKLEAFRFIDKFDYRFEIDPGVDTYSTKVPPLVFQPYLENAIWHGLMPKEERGKVIVRIKQKEDVLYCVIEDNGIGRKQSEQSKTKDQKRYQSRGMSMTRKRLEIMSELSAFTGITVRIVDLYDDQQQANGTRVELQLPVTYT